MGEFKMILFYNLIFIIVNYGKGEIANITT